MTQPATERGQNIIARNLQQILVALCIAAITGLFTWGTTLSKTVEVQREEYVKALTQLDARCNAILKEVNENESDILELQKKVEEINDDLRTRITRVEDYQLFNSKK